MNSVQLVQLALGADRDFHSPGAVVVGHLGVVI